MRVRLLTGGPVGGLTGGLVALMLLLLGGCSAPGDGAGDPASPSGVGQPSLAATPGPPDEDGQFSLDDTAEFPDGIEVSTPGTEVRRATATQRGVEASGGQIVVVSVLISNGTSSAYDPRSALIGATYGPQHMAATMVTDSAADLLTGFAAPIAPGDEATAPIGFAIPDSGLHQVTFTVDLADDSNAPVSFSGSIKK